jgi:prolyl-tRNA synthetase
MRYSQLFGKSIRAVSKDVRLRGHEYLLRGGFIRESSAGRYYLLPLGIRVADRIVKIIEEEMDAVGAQKMIAPTLHPRELWEETSRTESASFELMQVADRSGRKFVLGGTAEEMLVALVRQFAVSERELPFCLYQFSTKFRDELRARGGLLRAREFLMKDGYSFHASRADFERYYQSIGEVYTRIFSRLGLNARTVAADNGYMGGDYAHEFIVDSDIGESRYLVSEDGAYCAHEDIATFARLECNCDERELSMQEVAASRGASVEAGVEFYGEPAWRQIKSLIYITDTGEAILACTRADLEVNEVKLLKAVGCNTLRLATEEEVTALGSVAGFVSPLKLRLKKFGDISLTSVRNFKTGADEWQRDTINVNYGRDFTVDLLSDIAIARAGDLAVDTHSPLHEMRGVEVGNIFQLGTWYSERMEGASFTGGDGAKHNYFMGCYGIGVGRTMATIAELYADDRGLRWPESVSPYQYHLVNVSKESAAEAAALYSSLRAAGRSVLFDDREVSAGIKFSDADLIGITTRLVLSKRHVGTGEVEWCDRMSGAVRSRGIQEL